MGVDQSEGKHVILVQGLDEAHRKLVDCIGNHKSIEERLTCIERVLAESEQVRRVKELHEAQRVTQDAQSFSKSQVETDMCYLQERVGHIEKLVEQSADKHAQELESHRSRVLELERLMTESTSKSAKCASEADAAHKRFQDLQGHLATTQLRLDNLETLVGDSAERLRVCYDEIKHEAESRDKHHGAIQERLDNLEQARVLSDDFVTLVQRVDFSGRVARELRVVSELESQQDSNKKRVADVCKKLRHLEYMSDADRGEAIRGITAAGGASAQGDRFSEDMPDASPANLK